MDDAQLIDSPRERPDLTFVQFADNPPAGPGKYYGVTREQ